jgi:hypothetical protein
MTKLNDAAALTEVNDVERSLVPQSLIKPTPEGLDLPPLDTTLDFSLADIEIEPIQMWQRDIEGELKALPLVSVLCTTCYNRYNTPGTIYYMNVTLLNQCLATCT